MTETVELPLWLLSLVLIFAAIATLDRILVPSARWYLRRRMERMVAHLNQRLERPIAPFKMMRRQDMILKLAHDPEISAAVAEHVRTTGTREDVVFERVKSYAREIVPGFSAILYFGIATRIARQFSKAFYRVRISAPMAADVDREATVVFVMNHRSNMDYVLVTWLVAERSALSYAVGEWARIWPLSALIRAMGAFFIRRRSLSPLYRKVLARYVQMSAAAGVTQAFFPEGGLSVDGRIGAPRIGLLSYMMAGARNMERDIVFVPVGIGYDRVLEDRTLTAAGSGAGRFRVHPFAIAGRTLLRLLRGRFSGYGTAGVAFGPPISLREWRANTANDQPEAFARNLMEKVACAVPILPVPLVAAAIGPEGLARPDLLPGVMALAQRLEAVGATLMLPEGGVEAAVEEGLRSLISREILYEKSGQLVVAPRRLAILQFYGSAVLQRLEHRAAE
ncbi:1-acyl-sn-glycerol-3-phosphate acyltransferase [Falsirhodobacter sp. alg1]|uniref:1-acyl-sn-glycerol-3-phosphate acyltransferase n=1 Tax=Falsirhodobacter sp. alg1 TaxID=1472418 RepID=UPI0005EE111B|nr:1-acyl-sn-glycerol-3-phosphate acyltransferase [Falsirhodobacter sp. alg1]